MKKVTINISNKAMYSLLALVLISIVAVTVFAVTPNPGHDISEIGAPASCDSGEYLLYGDEVWYCGTPSQAGVCRYGDEGWVDCPPQSIPGVEGLYLKLSTDQLCWPTEAINGCSLTSLNCQDNQWFTYTASPNYCPGDVASFCQTRCEEIIACQGDATPYDCGSETDAYYSNGISSWCEDNSEELDLVHCNCVADESYLAEIPSSIGETCVPEYS